MRKDEVYCDLYRGKTDLSCVQHVDLWQMCLVYMHGIGSLNPQGKKRAIF